MRVLYLFFFMMLCIASAKAEPVISETTDYYDISGNSLDAIRARLNAHAQSNKGYDAYTGWEIWWNFTFRNGGTSGCSMATVKATVKIKYSFPQLQDITVDEDMRRAFETYSEKLMLHEKGHAEIGKAVARAIEAGMLSLPRASSCKGLESEANELGNKLIRDGNKKDLDYDAETDHGRTQGAVFP